MGIDISPLVYGKGSYSRSYSGFNLTRAAIAKAAGVDLAAMFGFGGDRQWSDFPEAHAGLVPLLNHSDCDGAMTSWECGEVAEALAPLLDKIEDEERAYAARLLDTMRAGANGAGVVFH